MGWKLKREPLKGKLMQCSVHVKVLRLDGYNGGHIILYLAIGGRRSGDAV